MITSDGAQYARGELRQEKNHTQSHTHTDFRSPFSAPRLVPRFGMKFPSRWRVVRQRRTTLGTIIETSQ